MSEPYSARVAAHRFGLGEATLNTVGADPRGWLLGQLGPADQPGEALMSPQEQLDSGRRLRRERKEEKRAAKQVPDNAMAPAQGGKAARAMDPSMSQPTQGEIDKKSGLAKHDQRQRLALAVDSRRPFVEHLVWFWSNHFTVSAIKPPVMGLVANFERVAIRPHIAGKFEAMLRASTTHPAMLIYLDNQRSAGPNSRLVHRMQEQPRQGKKAPPSGLNENLARELLELHTLGVARGPGSAYQQADVTALAAVLTGWRPSEEHHTADGASFDAKWHEPGTKRVLGREVPEGPQALDQVLHLLATHPATARYVSTRMARHFIADEPPPAVIERMVAAWQRSEGDLRAVTEAMVTSPEAWSPENRKLRTPEEFAVCSWRMLGLRSEAVQGDGNIDRMGQKVQAAPSPAGWPDRAEEWLGPEAVWNRVEWTQQVVRRLGQLDARGIARQSLGADLSERTARMIEGAADGPQALTLLLMSPDIQRR